MVPITIANHGRRPVRLLRPLRLERDDGGRFVDLSASGEVSDIWIRTDCAPRDGVIFWAGGDRECVDLAPGATIEVPPWLGMVGDAQCACDKCVTAPGGRYRFSARSCEGDARFEGEPFEFHPSP